MNGKGELRGLMKFFQPCTKEEYDEQVQRFTKEHHESMENRGIEDVVRKQMRDEGTRRG